MRRSVVIAGTVLGVSVLLALPVAGVSVLVNRQQTRTAESPSYDVLFGNQDSSNQILALDVKGEIDNQPADPTNPDPTMAYGYQIADQIAKTADDDSIKAIVLVIDSPGGTIYGARAIADAVAAYRAKTHRPVIAQVAGEADSGAYWVAASADAIWADYGTDIGSIGVISGPFRYYSGVTSLDDPQDGQIVAGNISSYNITAGTSKDEGDPYRQLTPAEQANFQQGVNNDYAAFVNYVAERRHVAASVIRDKIGALSFDPTTALGLKLIDKIAGRQATFDEAARRAGLKAGDYQAVAEPADGSGGAGSPSPSPVASSGSSAKAQCPAAQRLAILAQIGCYNK